MTLNGVKHALALCDAASLVPSDGKLRCHGSRETDRARRLATSLRPVPNKNVLNILGRAQKAYGTTSGCRNAPVDSGQNENSSTYRDAYSVSIMLFDCVNGGRLKQNLRTAPGRFDMVMKQVIETQPRIRKWALLRCFLMDLEPGRIPALLKTFVERVLDEGADVSDDESQRCFERLAELGRCPGIAAALELCLAGLVGTRVDTMLQSQCFVQARRQAIPSDMTPSQDSQLLQSVRKSVVGPWCSDGHRGSTACASAAAQKGQEGALHTVMAPLQNAAIVPHFQDNVLQGSAAAPADADVGGAGLLTSLQQPLSAAARSAAPVTQPDQPAPQRPPNPKLGTDASIAKPVSLEECFASACAKPSRRHWSKGDAKLFADKLAEASTEMVWWRAVGSGSYGICVHGRVTRMPSTTAGAAVHEPAYEHFIAKFENSRVQEHDSALRREADLVGLMQKSPNTSQYAPRLVNVLKHDLHSYGEVGLRPGAVARVLFMEVLQPYFTTLVKDAHGEYGEDGWISAAFRNGIIQFAGALVCLHDSGMVHLDLKPEHLMLRTGTWEIVLVDWGSAQTSRNTYAEDNERLPSHESKDASCTLRFAHHGMHSRAKTDNKLLRTIGGSQGRPNTCGYRPEQAAVTFEEKKSADIFALGVIALAPFCSLQGTSHAEREAFEHELYGAVRDASFETFQSWVTARQRSAARDSAALLPAEYREDEQAQTASEATEWFRRRFAHNLLQLAFSCLRPPGNKRQTAADVMRSSFVTEYIPACPEERGLLLEKGLVMRGRTRGDGTCDPPTLLLLVQYRGLCVYALLRMADGTIVGHYGGTLCTIIGSAAAPELFGLHMLNLGARAINGSPRAELSLADLHEASCAGSFFGSSRLNPDTRRAGNVSLPQNMKGPVTETAVAGGTRTVTSVAMTARVFIEAASELKWCYNWAKLKGSWAWGDDEIEGRRTLYNRPVAKFVMDIIAKRRQEVLAEGFVDASPPSGVCKPGGIKRQSAQGGGHPAAALAPSELASRLGPSRSSTTQVASHWPWQGVDLTGIPDSPPRASEMTKPFLTSEALPDVLSRQPSAVIQLPASGSQRSGRYFEGWFGGDRRLLSRVQDPNALVVPETHQLSGLLDADQPMGCVPCILTGEYTTLTVEDLECLRPGAWLHADLMNVVLRLLEIQDEMRAMEEPGAQRSAFVSTYAWAQIRDNMFSPEELDSRFFRKRDIWQRDGIFFPIVHCDLARPKGFHWGLVYASRSKSTLTYLDSEGFAAPGECLQKLGDALNANRLLRNMELVVWRHLTLLPPRIPQQGSGDCGMNVLAMIDCLAAGMEVSGFDSNDITTMRMKLRQLLCSCRDQRQDVLAAEFGDAIPPSTNAAPTSTTSRCAGRQRKRRGVSQATGPARAKRAHVTSVDSAAGLGADPDALAGSGSR